MLTAIQMLIFLVSVVTRAYKGLQDPRHTCSRTGYLINVFGCPVLWWSKLEIKIALSTMEVKYVALSQSCKDLFPIINLVVELSKALQLSPDSVDQMHVKSTKNTWVLSLLLVLYLIV